MSKQPKSTPKEQPPAKSAAVLLLGDMASTTWRMFIPTIGLAMLGRYADDQFGTAPIGFAAGVVLGSVIAWRLVKKQLNKVP